jgi:hypothetical protein
MWTGGISVIESRVLRVAAIDRSFPAAPRLIGAASRPAPRPRPGPAAADGRFFVGCPVCIGVFAVL